MSLETSVKETSAGLGSVRATERKKSAENMKDFLMRNAVPSLLSDNTIKKQGYTWNDIFDDINELVLKETEKFESSKTFDTVMGPLCSTLLHLCVAGSNKGKAFIKCEKIIESCLLVLKDKRLTKAIGDAYLNLLFKHVLPCDHYLSYITPDSWEELLDVCLSICNSKECKLDDFTKFRLVLLVIKNGTKCCQFVIPLRDSLPKLKKSFLGVVENKKVQEVTIDIIIVLLETLSSECRLTMCEFTETILTSVIKLYDQNLDYKKKCALFKLLHLTVELHHPQGRKHNEEGSLASNWGIWNKHMHNILEIICLEGVHSQKIRKQFDNTLHCDDFYHLAASVYYQIFNLEAQATDEENGNSSKRQRVTINKSKSLNDLIDECRQNHVPWLGIIHIYIKHYGSSISKADYISLMGVTTSLITSANNNYLNWDVINEMARLIVQKLTSLDCTKEEYEASILFLWNSCVRTSTVINVSHSSAVHSIMQHLISLEIIKYQNIQPLIKLYYENGMPVTDQSVITFSIVFSKFFNKCSNFNDRLKCFNWLIQGKITSLDARVWQELLLRLLASDNLKSSKIDAVTSANDNLYDMLFNSVEKCTLFSEFELELTKSTTVQGNYLEPGHIELNSELNKAVNEHLKHEFLDQTNKLKNKEITLLEYIKFNCVVLAYVDLILKYDLPKRDQMNEEQIYCSLKEALKLIYESVIDVLTRNTQSSEQQIALLKCVHTMLVTDYDHLLNATIRSSIGEDFFYCINNILNKEESTDDIEEIYEGEDINPYALRHQCVILLAAFCRLRGDYRTEILDLILDPKLYNLNISWEIDCIINCIELLNDDKVQDRPLEQIFAVLRGMCKDLFRNSDASYKILKILVKIIDQIWSNENTMRQNCFIMVKSYLLRCEKLYYPPHVVALVYECAAKITALNLEQNRDVDSIFLDNIMDKVKGDSHTLRIYCCYLLRHAIIHLSEAKIQLYLDGLKDIFIVKVSERNDSVLKDESVNRTLTVLHCVFALVVTKNSLINTVITEIMQMQKEKSLDKNLVTKVLNRITKNISKMSIDAYTNEKVLYILNYWFSKNNSLEDLPIFLFGFNDVDMFLERHLKWLIAADILWRKNGLVKDSDVLKQVQSKSGESVDTLIEMCICNILVLCLPYIVTEKYRLSYTGPGKLEWSANASKMFLFTRQVLGDTKWSSLFVENMSELLLLIATHLSDHAAARLEFNVDIPKQVQSYHYPKEIFTAILNEVGGLIDENVLQYHCENQPLVIFKTLFKLWENVLNDNIFEYKVLALHTFITFLESVPLGYPSDAFIWNFTCNSLGQVIKVSQNKNDIRVYTKALKRVLRRLLPQNVDIIRKVISNILTILMIKKEEGFQDECAPLLNYLIVDMKGCLKESEDVVDYVTSLSQNSVENLSCSSIQEFNSKLNTFKKSLACSSHETLSNMRSFLKQNKQYINKLYDEMNAKGFSDDCGTSIIHQIIFSLSNTLKLAVDDKTKIEACNCLAEIGNYDLKTLVTVPPSNTSIMTDVQPKQYFAIVVIKSLSDIIFDENPAVTSGVARALRSLLKYREGKVALDLEDDKQILTPFATADCKSFADFKINESRFNALFPPVDKRWIPDLNDSHSQWLTRMTVALLGVMSSSTNYIKDLRAVCALKPSLCQKMLPPSIGLLLSCSSESHVKTIGHQLNQFFKYIWDMFFYEEVKDSCDSDNDAKRNNNLSQDHKMIVQYMLDVVNFVRLQRGHYSPRPDRTVETLNYLRLEYDKVAWAATIADQNLAAIYYGDLWATAQNGGVPPSSPEATTNFNGGDDVQSIFRKCFVSIGELDAIDGCGTTHLTSENEKRKHLINTSQFSDALLLHDIALSCGTQDGHNLHYGVVKSLHKSGMHHLALQYIKSLPENDELNDIKYECLSFLGDWSDFVDTRELEEKSTQINFNPYSTIKAFRYSCLKDCLNLQTKPDIENKLLLPLNRAKLSVARLCQNLNMENCQSVYKVLTNLHLFRDIEDYFSVRCNKTSLGDLLDQWKVGNLPTFHDFKHLETLISQRSLILDQAAKTYTNSLQNIAKLQIQYSELSLSNQRVQMAQRLLAVVKQHQSCDEVALVDSQISWAKGHKDIALSLLRNIVNQPSSDVRLAATSLRQYGLWMAESKRDNARDIIDRYLKKSLEVINNNYHHDTTLKLYNDIAKFADAEYKQVVAYMNSSIFEKKVKCAESMKDTALSLKSQLLSKDERKAFNTNQRFGQIDEDEIASIRAEKESFLHLAMRYYLLSLKEGESNNLSVFRVISLWLDNPGIQLADSETSSFEDLLHSIPSWKYVTVLPQLAPHLTNEESCFAENLRRLIKRCALEHPHHTLPILFSLRNSDKDRQILNASSKVGSSTQYAHAQEPRVVAADNIITQLALENTVMNAIIAQMTKMCDATISFANYVPQTKEAKQKIPSAELIHRLGHLDAIPIPTVTIPISHDCTYSFVTTLYSFENYFELVGGINFPKKIICKGSDGRARIVLVKGEDDLRQDAVMQQVFNIVNTLLENNPVTSRNKLLIRTYKVVPMSRRSGVLEWCEGTMPIGAFLVGPNGAHARYRPKDISFQAARGKLMELHEKRKSNQVKLAFFLRLMKEFRPVFHYFFTEHYLDPVTWYERRLAYTKSVATSSMVGYILGLGDRHLQNILIDKKTAEVVHIDFGIAFDQGKTLPTPETIPFRLTQDIVAAFGCCGVEGIFRRCCEKTMQLLRDNQETLLTILEVLLCDPLYSWTVTSKQQNVLTAPSGDITVNQNLGSDGSLAKRALLSVSSKLSGTEGGVAGGVAVPGQVARLIHTAMDPANLCRLYPGWQPYL